MLDGSFNIVSSPLSPSRDIVTTFQVDFADPRDQITGVGPANSRIFHAMNTRYIIILLAVVVILVAGGVVIAGIRMEAPVKPVEKVIPNDRFMR